ncbi:hypothetical protein [Flammeovirga aprica]|uniref:Uncharacterized protein n=1 Tax=Flammeovirga aprica JL-4 TaxID=694437 RepID=A0A7X9P0B0_9BACT|nr:hypothetical protein [Flammeovirga aprica]NME67211.1 hypothetical protein [Flammeovirga aprica JL-4]
MKDIKIIYKVDGKEYNIQKKIPQSYDDCTYNQLVKLVKLRHKFPAVRCKLEAIRYLFELKNVQFAFIPAELLNLLTKQLNWITDEPYLYTQQLKKVRNYIGPEGVLRDVSFLQYVYADSFANEFTRTKNTEELYKLIATLWIEKGKRFDSKDISVRAKKIELTWRQYQVDIAIMFFMSMKNAFVNKLYATVFKGSGNNSTAEPEEDPWFSATRILAKDGSLGTIDDVQQENVHTVLKTLQEIIREDNKMRKAHDNTRSV